MTRARSLPAARAWLQHAAGTGLSATTIDAYSRAVERYLAGDPIEVICHEMGW